MENNKRPPSDRGQGRKPISKTGELMRTRPVRMTDSEWEKCKRLGGAVWVRDKIKRAPEPAGKNLDTGARSDPAGALRRWA